MEPGDTVQRGQICGHLHFVDNPGGAPQPCHFEGNGMVICKRHLGRVERGDGVVHLATDVADDMVRSLGCDASTDAGPGVSKGTVNIAGMGAATAATASSAAQAGRA